MAYYLPPVAGERIFAENWVRTQIDLGITDAGYQLCNPVRNGPLLFGHNSLHYVYEGKGFIIVDNKTFSVDKGDIFLAPAGSVSIYYPDKESPWKYCWIGIYGLESPKYLKRAGLSKDCPVLSLKQTDVYGFITRVYKNILENTLASRTRALGEVYALFAEIFREINADSEKERNANEYIQTALFFIHENYMHGITVKDICKRVNLNRTYFSGIFKESTKLSPMEYLLETRIKNAERLLAETKRTIAEIGELVGFKDSVNFSIQFKKHLGLSPKKYRDQNYTGIAEE